MCAHTVQHSAVDTTNAPTHCAEALTRLDRLLRRDETWPDMHLQSSFHHDGDDFIKVMLAKNDLSNLEGNETECLGRTTLLVTGAKVSVHD